MSKWLFLGKSCQDFYPFSYGLFLYNFIHVQMLSMVISCISSCISILGLRLRVQLLL